MMQWSADITEHAHVTKVKNPAHAGNNQNHYSQIACHLDCVNKCFQFDLAMQIATMLRLEHQPDGNGNGGDDDNENREEHEPDEATWNLSLYSSLTCKVMDYFQIAHVLANNTSPAIPLPLQTFASSTTATHLVRKPTLRMTISEALESFGLPDLHNAILGCLVCCSNGKPHTVEGWRPATSSV